MLGSESAYSTKEGGGMNDAIYYVAPTGFSCTVGRQGKKYNLSYTEWFDVRDKIVVDIGADFGTSPLYFLAKGAKYVVGFSLEKQYFYHPKYMHIVGIDYYPEDSLKMWEIETGNDPLKTIDIDLEIQPEVPISDMVLKCDAEGWEWNLSAGFIDSMHDWIIALHCPILNPFLFEWIKKNGLLVAQPIAFPTKNGDEFAIYRKRLQ